VHYHSFTAFAGCPKPFPPGWPPSPYADSRRCFVAGRVDVPKQSKKRQEEAEKAVEAARNGENVPEVGPAGSEPADGHAAAEPQPDEARIETRVGLAQLSWI